ncbi:uncharacterized protein LY89DRAFT_390397 [Mollisia scopiformis]|uniref:Transmembrane protein n=1 Tax=Mollisia scopiformis TaxID=149040 RepID=A0A194XP00_MOLSC|nr:uncharacterized protein LY89DRAFT_390397 [Mollisia scopiformis]KUJ21970.1 hypothetical protein LY89DRAFT_390397 [Mollisia scopiformis]
MGEGRAILESHIYHYRILRNIPIRRPNWDGRTRQQGADRVAFLIASTKFFWYSFSAHQKTSSSTSICYFVPRLSTHVFFLLQKLPNFSCRKEETIPALRGTSAFSFFFGSIFFLSGSNIILLFSFLFYYREGYLYSGDGLWTCGGGGAFSFFGSHEA